jgi:hypothetical protein
MLWKRVRQLIVLVHDSARLYIWQVLVPSLSQ